MSTNMTASITLAAKDNASAVIRGVDGRLRDLKSRFVGAGSGAAAMGQSAGAALSNIAANASRAGAAATRAFSGVTATVRGTFSALTSFKTLLAGLVAGATVRSFVGVADSLEKTAIALETVTGSAAAGADVMARMRQLALESAVDFEKLAGAATVLASAAGDSAELENLVKIAADLSAAFPTVRFEEIASNLQRAMTAGIASAELFRERGISAFLGFQSGVTVSAEETRKRILAFYADAENGLKGATARMNGTWSGAMSQLKDLWFDFREVLFVKSGIADALKEALQGATDWMRKFLESHNLALEAAIVWEDIKLAIELTSIAIQEAYDKAVAFFELLANPAETFGNIWDSLAESLAGDTPSLDAFFEKVRTGVRGAVGMGAASGIEDVIGVDIPVAPSGSFMFNGLPVEAADEYPLPPPPVVGMADRFAAARAGRDERVADLRRRLGTIAGNEPVGAAQPFPGRVDAMGEEALQRIKDIENEAKRIKADFQKLDLDGVKAWTTERTAMIEEMHEKQLLTTEEYEFAISQTVEEAQERTRKAIEATGSTMDRVMLAIKDRATDMANNIGNSFAKMATNIASGTANAKEALRDFVKSMIESLTQAIAKMLVFAAIGALIGILVPGAGGLMMGLKVGAQAGLGGGFAQSGPTSIGAITGGGAAAAPAGLGISAGSLAGTAPSSREPSVVNNYQINAIDTQSFAMAAAKSERETGIFSGLSRRASLQPGRG